MQHSLHEELKQRGLIYQETLENMSSWLNTSRTFYCGFDPSADSLHIGSLMPLITMRRFQMAGHKPIVLLGGATGMIGDPSFKSAERVLLNRDTIEKNIFGIRQVIEKFIDLKGPQGAMMVNNSTWMEKFSFIDFLRDVGKHFTVNYMLAKESIKSRIEDREQGISFTEFAYMLLQSYDFYVLNKNYNCQLQLGGSDQWGNITAGVEFIRRMRVANNQASKEEAVGLTMPLVTKSDGTKFGKTETGNIWLDARKTSPYQFYQFFVRIQDSDVMKFINYFSFKSLEEIAALDKATRETPEKRLAQTELARELTLLVHGEDELAKVEKATQALFSGELRELDKSMLLEVFSEAPSVKVPKAQIGHINIVDLLVESKLATSKGNARKDVQGGGVYVNSVRVEKEDMVIKPETLLYQSIVVLRKGKKSYCVVLFV
ncbi:MAG: tyrosine--tRNA ligase [Bdellovibrionales bacterium]|nr:tyrosine--tRNA ligase [Bdellovibrionales bacterium]